MKERCNNPNSKDYANYGGRGISVCPEWNELAPFYEWALKNGYNDSLTIDRINVNDNYKPSNCRWATRKEQNRNTRQNVPITIDGITKIATEWAEESGVKAGTIRWRYAHGIRGKDLISNNHL